MKWRSASIRLALAAGISIAGLLGLAKAQILGETTSEPASAPPAAKHPLSRDDQDVTTAIPITSLTTSSIITEAASNFKLITKSTALDNLVFAGAAGVGKNFTPIASSDFFIDVYEAWVVNSNNNANNLPSPSGKVNHNRGVTNQDAGGMNILFTYTPTAGTDPRTINFLQAFSVSTNGGKPVVYVDNGSVESTSPYYNSNEATDDSSSTGDNDKSSAPLTIPADSNAWMLDVPYTCEAGTSGTGQGCEETTPQTDESVTRYADTFNVFIESDQTYKGTTYQVLYGGFQWGFTYTATDTPEPATWAMLLVGFAGLGYAGYRARRTAVAAPL